jgi:hypothetical protein
LNGSQLDTLLQSGMLISRDDEFGDPMDRSFTVNVGAIRIKAIVSFTDAQLDIIRPIRDAAIASLSKLELVAELIRRGWNPSDGILVDYYEQGGDLVFPVDILTRPLLYMCALVESERIFAKPGDIKRIHHFLTQSYYKVLLNLKNLSPLQFFDNLSLLNDSDFSSLLGIEAPTRDGTRATNKKRRVIDVDPQPRAPGQKRARPAIADPMAHALAPLAITDEIIRIPPVKFVCDGFRISIIFDNFTSCSGERRAALYCNNCAHRCRKYVQTKDHGGNRGTCVFLAAWQLAVRSLAPAQNHVRDANPSPADYALAEAVVPAIVEG